MSTKIAALVLAAGRSTRMGDDNKLLLTFNDKTLVSYVVDQLAESCVSNIYVVTGNEASMVKASINANVTFIHNPDYPLGLSTSVKAGVEALPNDCDGVMICLGDMPYITAKDYDVLIAAFELGKIIVPTCDGKIGNPLIFSGNFFDEFEALEGDRGARSLLKKHPEAVIEVDLNTEAIFRDIDTPEEYSEI